jgi:hypothetical protein
LNDAAASGRSLTMTPSANVYWKDILPTDVVVATKHVYVVHRNGAPFAVAFWMGSEAREAQRFLDKRSGQ